MTNLPSLADRRLYLKLCSLYKIVHNLSYFPPNIIVPKVTRLYTSTPFTLYQPFAHTIIVLSLILYHTGTHKVLRLLTCTVLPYLEHALGNKSAMVAHGTLVLSSISPPSTSRTAERKWERFLNPVLHTHTHTHATHTHTHSVHMLSVSHCRAAATIKIEYM